MLVLIKLANLNYFYLLNVILNHMNLKSIWASSLISEYVLDLYKYLSLSQLTRALYKLILAITVYSCKWGITHISVQPYFGDCLAFPLPPPNLTIFKPSSQDTNEINKEVIAVLGRERIDNLFLYLTIWFWKGRDSVKF